MCKYDIRPYSRTQEVECVSYDIRPCSGTQWSKL